MCEQVGTEAFKLGSVEGVKLEGLLDGADGVSEEGAGKLGWGQRSTADAFGQVPQETLLDVWMVHGAITLWSVPALCQVRLLGREVLNDGHQTVKLLMCIGKDA